MNNETMNNWTRDGGKMERGMRKFAILLLAAYCLLLTILPVGAQEEDPLATAVLLPGVVAVFWVVVAVVLMAALAWWIRSR
jgi:hypothetical protein